MTFHIDSESSIRERIIAEELRQLKWKEADSQTDAKDSSGKAGDDRAIEARNNLDHSGNRPAIAHGKLEKLEQQSIFSRQAECKKTKIEMDQAVQSYGLTPLWQLGKSFGTIAWLSSPRPEIMQATGDPWVAK